VISIVNQKLEVKGHNMSLFMLSARVMWLIGLIREEMTRKVSLIHKFLTYSKRNS